MRKCEICLKEFEPLPSGPTRKYCFECSPAKSEGEGAHKVSLRQAYKKELVSLLGGKCFHCGATGHQAMFDLHHVNPKEKSFAISSDAYTRKWETVLLEAKKCVLLCKNCHALHHIGEIQIDFSKRNYTSINERLEIIKNNLEEKINTCEKCGSKIVNNVKLCKECNSLEQRTIERPEPLELAKMIIETSFVAVGDKFGVSDNSIKKWCKTYNIPHLKEELKDWYYIQIGEEKPSKEKRDIIKASETKVSMCIKDDLIKTFDSIEDCAKYLAEEKQITIDRAKEGISRVVRNKRNSYLGYVFKVE